MIINNFDVECVSLTELKTYPPIYGYRPLSLTVALLRHERIMTKTYHENVQAQ